MLTTFSTLEGELKAERMLDAFEQRADMGIPWGPPAFGYVKVGTGKDQRWDIDPDTAPLVREAYKDFLAGRTLSAIARDWNDRGVTTGYGNPWTQAALSQLLRSPRYAGLRAYDGDIVGEAQWEAIVPEATWRRAVTKITDPGRRSGGTGKAAYLGTGILLCGICGATVRKGQRSRDKVPFYRCNAAHHLGRSTGPVDDVLSALLVRRLAQPDALADPEPDDGLDAERRDLMARLGNLATDYADGVLTRDQMRAGTERIRARLTDLDRRMQRAETAALASLTGTGPDPEDDALRKWADAPLHLRRTALSLLVTAWLLPLKAAADAVPDDAFVLHDEHGHPLIAARWNT